MEKQTLLNIGNLSIEFFSQLGIVVCEYQLHSDETIKVRCIDLTLKSQFPDLEEVEVRIINPYGLN